MTPNLFIEEIQSWKSTGLIIKFSDSLEGIVGGMVFTSSFGALHSAVVSSLASVIKFEKTDFGRFVSL